MDIFEANGKTYEVWAGSLADKAVQTMIKRLQILVTFFIEGGSFIEMDDPEWSLDRWTIFFLYERQGAASKAAAQKESDYVFVGYSTVYRYFLFGSPTSDPKPKKKQMLPPAVHDFTLSPATPLAASSLPCRSRISQFLILPPFQKGGHGSRFYRSIFKHYHSAPTTIEITVEDPSEAFDDLRDLNDLAFLRTLPKFADIVRLNISTFLRQKGLFSVPSIIDTTALESFRLTTKIAPRQFARLVEMHLLSRIPLAFRQTLTYVKKTGTPEEQKSWTHQYRVWGLFVKQRLYRHNKDQLAQLDRRESIERLEQAFGGVEADYARLLRECEKRSKATDGKEEPVEPVKGVDSGKGKGKRVNEAKTEDGAGVKRLKIGS